MEQIKRRDLLKRLIGGAAVGPAALAATQTPIKEPEDNYQPTIEVRYVDLDDRAIRDITESILEQAQQNNRGAADRLRRAIG